LAAVSPREGSGKIAPDATETDVTAEADRLVLL
jgi:hypothetical protein